MTGRKMWLPFNCASDALFLDIDGTLLDIASTAQEVQVPKNLIKNLEQLKQKLDGALAFVSGRMIHEIDELFEPLRLACAGAHGAEWRFLPDGPIEKSEPLPDLLRDDVACAFKDVDGIFVEDKIYAIAVHYRQAPEKAPMIKEKLYLLLRPYEDDIAVIHGRKVFEASRASRNKGYAINKLLTSPLFRNRRPVFLGDDTTDISAIGACMSGGGIAARVGRGDPNQKSAFESPAHVRSWIQGILTRI